MCIGAERQRPRDSGDLLAQPYTRFALRSDEVEALIDKYMLANCRDGNVAELNELIVGAWCLACAPR